MSRLDQADGGWDDDGIEAEDKIDERASIAEEEAEQDEWESWLDDEDYDL